MLQCSVDIIPGKGLALNGAFGLASTTQLQIGFWLNFGQICEREAPSAVAWVQDYTWLIVLHFSVAEVVFYPLEVSGVLPCWLGYLRAQKSRRAIHWFVDHLTVTHPDHAGSSSSTLGGLPSGS